MIRTPEQLLTLFLSLPSHRTLSRSMLDEPVHFDRQKMGEALAGLASAEPRYSSEKAEYSDWIDRSLVAPWAETGVAEWDATVASGHLNTLLSLLSLSSDYSGREAITTWRQSSSEAAARGSAPEESVIENQELTPQEKSSWLELLHLVNRCAVETRITDLALQHDHYLYGKPKSE